MFKALASFAAALLVAVSCGRNPEVAPYGTYSEGLIASIEPQGWIKEFLDRQATGMTGHPEALAYPYNTAMWTGETQRNGTYGSDWWRFEQSAYFTDGAMRLGYLTGNEAMLDLASKSLDYTLSKADEYGELGVNKEHYLWPFAVFFRAMQAAYEATGDERIIPALRKHYLSYPGRMELGYQRNIMTIEGMLWTYGKTGDTPLLDFACESWDKGGFSLDSTKCVSAEPIDCHGVTYTEYLKLPMLLYAYTGNEKYLECALAAQSKLEKYHMLPDGIPSSAEFVQGNGSLAAHESCVITDYAWTLGHFLMTTGEARWADGIERSVFNAGPGAVTKDFKSLQYFSAPNQFIATGHSNHCKFCHGRTWMAYRPTHQTECCAGNIQRFMPNYVSRMWLYGTRKDEVVAAMYGPSKLSVKLPCGAMADIDEQTSYPFEDTVRFVVNEDSRFALTFRIPGWCKGNVSASINGKAVDVRDNGKGFATLRRNWKKGDRLELSFGFDTETVEFHSTDAQGRLPEGNKAQYPLCAADSTDSYAYITRGPLLFSYSIPSVSEEDTEYYEYMHGKVPGLPDFKCWNITPAGEWNYAFAGTAAPEFIRTGAEGYPFDAQSVPCVVRVPVKSVSGWTLDEGIYTSRVPQEFVTEGEVKYIDLVPYGSTTLRLTLFPYSNN